MGKVTEVGTVPDGSAAPLCCANAIAGSKIRSKAAFFMVPPPAIRAGLPMLSRLKQRMFQAGR
jgi:hypothetical protein